MKFMLLMKATADSEAGVLPSERLLAEMTKYNEEMVKAGVMLAGEGLHPSSNGARVRFSPGGTCTVAPGPFAATSELVAGFWMIQANSSEEAIGWVKRCPNPDDASFEIEIRQVFEDADFGDALTPELQAAEARMREELERGRSQR